MTGHQIIVEKFSKTYRVVERESGLLASLRSFSRRTYRNVEAVRDISFTIEEGEIVGFLGPNGAGKTTLLKMLAGLLYPSQGRAHVADFVPWERKSDYLRLISMVLGNKSQMLWDIPPRDSFRILGEIYRVPRRELNETLDELFELLDMHELLKKPVRTLSLGERMKCELVAALLYRPRVLFLDEPTLGLDISMQRRVRQFVAKYNKRHNATILLTSHYMADVEALCPRILLIHHGQLLYDGSLRALANKLAPNKLLRILLREDATESFSTSTLPENISIIEHEQSEWTLSVPPPEITSLTAHLLSTFPIVDLAIEDAPVETVIEAVYQGGAI